MDFNKRRELIGQAFGGTTREERKVLISHLKQVIRDIRVENSLDFSIGDRVQFTGRRGRTLTGVITKKGPQRATIKTDEDSTLASVGSWQVPYSMLDKIEKKRRRLV
jgi:hypothetical protein